MHDRDIVLSNTRMQILNFPILEEERVIKGNERNSVFKKLTER